MAAVTVGTVAKKVAEVLASNKKGRKFIGYTVGIVLFILSIPIIVIFCLFGGTAGSGDFKVDDAAPGAVHGLFSDPATMQCFKMIEQTFYSYDLTDNDIDKAKMLTVSYLNKQRDEKNFYERLAYCFANAAKDKDVYDLVSETFGVEIPDKDKDIMDEMYGKTPIRITESGGTG